mmetsp:Transcript_20188/g.52932  ORF Transcript_20188/g.52932 Transcript_20188/m.52932 type:complete len:100 (-) Transcript_20188:18-317(-)
METRFAQESSACFLMKPEADAEPSMRVRPPPLPVRVGAGDRASFPEEAAPEALMGEDVAVKLLAGWQHRPPPAMAEAKRRWGTPLFRHQCWCRSARYKI